MSSEKTKAVQVMSWEKLRQKTRNQKEELLYQSILKLQPDYWTGVKLSVNAVYGAFYLRQGEKTGKRASSVSFLLDEKNFLITIMKDETGIITKAAREAAGKDLEEGCAFLFDWILKQGQNMTEHMEKYLVEMEREIISGAIERGRNQIIFECKRSLTLWKNDYIQILNIAEGINGLEQKKNEKQEHILNEECSCFFRVYENKIRRLTEEIQFLYEELLHVREALDEALAYDQNQIMKVFTAVTTIFMPLTLVAGWYGMNFNSMPELTWSEGYRYVILLSIIIIIVCLFFFKKKKLM